MQHCCVAYSPKNSVGQNFGLSGQCFGDWFFAVHANWRIVLLVDNAFNTTILTEWASRIVVSATNVLFIWRWMVLQWCFCHWATVLLSWAWHRTGRCYMWLPCWSATLNGQFKWIARTHNQILGIFVSHIVCFNIVNSNHWVTWLETGMIGYTSMIYLPKKMRKM